MRVLFLGGEEEAKRSMEAGGGGRPLPFFFTPDWPTPGDAGDGDALVAPAARFLLDPPAILPLPVLACGPAVLLPECLEAGCADYLREPWTLRELEARLGCLERASIALRSNPAGPGARRLLRLLAANPGRAVPRDAIAAALGMCSTSGRAIDMRVARLRSALRSIGKGETADLLVAEDGGYRLGAGASRDGSRRRLV